jgi:hypothetical protein
MRWRLGEIFELPTWFITIPFGTLHNLEPHFVEFEQLITQHLLQTIVIYLKKRN